jgi:hypothetical protein
MTEEVKSVSDMIRLTAENSLGFMQQIAEHVDKLEEGVIQLQKRVEELEAELGNNTKAQ